MVEFLLIIVFGIHLLLVDLAMAGPLAALAMEWRGSRSEATAAAAAIGRDLARYSLWALILGALLGLALLGLLWIAGDHSYFDAWRAIPRSRIVFGAVELLVSLVGLTAYLLLWDRWRAHRVWHRLLALAAATNLLLHFPPLFAIVAMIRKRAELWHVAIDSPHYRRLWLEPEVLSRIVHVWLASAAVAGVVAMHRAMPRRRASDDVGSSPRFVSWGARVALGATLLQLPVGAWTFLQLPPGAQTSLLGQDLAATVLMATSLLAALGLLHQLAAVALGDIRSVKRATTMLVAVVLLMSATLHLVEHGATEPPPAHAVRAGANDRELVIATTSGRPPLRRYRRRRAACPAE